MWNVDKSLRLSIVSVKIFTVIAIVFCIGGYPISKQYVEYIHQPDVLFIILITGYICLILAFFIFYYLHKLLMNIKNNEVFVDSNEVYLRQLSWLCMLVSIVCIIACIGYLTFLLVSIVFAFIALILRVVKNVIAQAIQLKKENDYTI